jgi:hypothetical protein
VHSLAEMAEKLSRSTIYLSGLQKRFELPLFEGATYPATCLEWFRTVVYLRTFGVSEESLRDLWIFPAGPGGNGSVIHVPGRTLLRLA